MSRLLHSLKHRHARLMVMTQVCVRQKLVACVCLHILGECICYLRRLHVSLAVENEKPSPLSLPRKRSWMGHSSDRRQWELALTVWANEREGERYNCVKALQSYGYSKHAQLILTHCTHTHTQTLKTDELFGLYWHLGGKTMRSEHKVSNKIPQVLSTATRILKLCSLIIVKYLQMLLIVYISHTLS